MGKNTDTNFQDDEIDLADSGEQVFPRAMSGVGESLRRAMGVIWASTRTRQRSISAICFKVSRYTFLIVEMALRGIEIQTAHTAAV
jgi:hypothetical protein